jgi:cytochrome c oxidase subunit 1
MGSQGMPRRYWDYDPRYEIYHQLSTIGAFMLGISMFVTVMSLMASFRYGKRAPRNPWGGSSLEWQAPTPPPLYNFEKPPVLHELYNYDDLVEVEPDVWERRAPLEVEPEEAPGDAHAHAKVAAPEPAPEPEPKPTSGLAATAGPVAPTVPPGEDDE